VDDSKLEVEESEITDGGLLGDNGILGYIASRFGDGVAGIGGMAEGRGAVTARQ